MIGAVACSSGGVDPEPNPDPDPPPADTAGAVAPDGILETVTWNIEWYGSRSNGPDDEQQQTNNVIKVVDSLDADLYAFQEINTQEDLNKLTSRMKGYSGFAADYINYENFDNQKMAFVFNTQTIDSISSGAIIEMQDENDWAGRLPLYFNFNYKRSASDSNPIEVYAIVVHAKAQTGDNDQERMEAYQRRKRAAQSLYGYLTETKPDANIVFLGDYNDDVDVSIYEKEETPYQPFVADPNNFRVISSSLSQKGISSTVRYDDMVDHITISNEMEDYFTADSEMRFKPTDNFIDLYGGSTSDHYPIMAEFDFGQ